ANTALGYTSLYSNTTGTENVGIGSQVLLSNTTGSQNTGMGLQTLYNNISGVRNTALGYQAGYANTTGINNIFVGDLSGYKDATGASGGAITGHYNIVIGTSQNMLVDHAASSQLNIGNLIFGTSLGTGSTLGTGNIGIGTSTPGYKLQVVGTTASPSLSAHSGTFAISGGAATSQLTMGNYAGIPYGAWLQAKDHGNEGNSYPLILNPLGGNVGIGTTTPGSKLSVAAGASIGANYGVAAPTNGLIVEGNVGIGTASPAKKLHVVGPYVGDSTATMGGVVARFDAGITHGLQFGTMADPYTWWIQSSDNNNIATTYPLALNPNGGNVGIGTTSPSNKLEVSGDARVGSLVIGNGTASSYQAGSIWTDANWGMLFRAKNAGSVSGAAFSFHNSADTNLLNITDAGNVGIGTTSPASLLTVVGGGACFSGSGATVACGNTAGNLYYRTANTGTYDIAENYPTFDESITRSTIVALDTQHPGAVVVATSSNNTFGVVSTDPGMVLGGADASMRGQKMVPVALSGRVPVRVNLDGGPIAVGDELSLSSVAGVAKKAGDGEQSIGYALENYAQEVPGGKVEVFITHGTVAGLTVADLTAQLAAPLPTLLSQAGPVKSFLTNLFARVTEWLADAGNGIADFFAGRVHTKELCVGENGNETCITKTQLDNLLAGQTASAATVGTGGDSSGGGVSSSTPDTTAPVLTLNGENPATILTGETYADMGVTASDNVDAQVFVYASVDGGSTIQPGQMVTLDTTEAADHTITFTVTDEAGNTATATRTVHVVMPAVAPEAAPVEEPVADSGAAVAAPLDVPAAPVSDSIPSTGSTDSPQAEATTTP
ncbi:MAG: DUF5011 domain-containing protein, partial [bacterium]|nr:DUF5011 domain-containing protein [bacterium]